MEVHEGPRNISQENLTHWLISTQVQAAVELLGLLPHRDGMLRHGHREARGLLRRLVTLFRDIERALAGQVPPVILARRLPPRVACVEIKILRHVRRSTEPGRPRYRREMT